MKTIKQLTEEFNQEFGFILTLSIDSKENFEKIRTYYIYKHLNTEK